MAGQSSLCDININNNNNNNNNNKIKITSSTLFQNGHLVKHLTLFLAHCQAIIISTHSVNVGLKSPQYLNFQKCRTCYHTATLCPDSNPYKLYTSLYGRLSIL